MAKLAKITPWPWFDNEAERAADGQDGQGGWLTDKFGFSWQVVPSGLCEVVTNPDAKQSQAA